MFIRYQYVRNIAWVLGLGGCLGFCATREPPAPERPARPPAVAGKQAGSTATSGAGGASAPAPALPMGPAMLDAQAIARASQPAQPKSKVKDALGKSFPWKLNLYEETGDQQYDRAKVDRDRNDSWDESWTFKGGRWEKEGGALVWSGRSWVGPAELAHGAVQAAAEAAAPAAAAPAAAAPAAAAPAAAAPAAAAPAAASGPDEVLAGVARRMLSERAGSDKLKDVLRGSGPKVNFYDDDRNGTWDRAKVDKDRNDDWEEKWTRKAGRLERKQEDSGRVLIFDGGRWVAKQ